MGVRSLTAVIDRDLFQLGLPLRLRSLSNHFGAAGAFLGT